MRIEIKKPSQIEKIIKPYEKVRKEKESVISNTETPRTDWMRKVTESVRISDIARKHGIDVCPRCNYILYFDDSRGWFCCAKKRWRKECDFAGNIVDFVEFVGGEI